MNYLLPLEFDLFGGIAKTFDAAMQPLYTAISWLIVAFHWLWSNILDPNSGWTWILAIMSLTFLVRTLMIPLFVRSIRSSRNMQALQPKMQALQKKYGHDREALSRETMKLYQEEGVNPMSSCLPLLIQMPIFISLFTTLNGVAKGRPVGYFLKNRPDLVESLRHADIFGARLSGTFLPMDHGFGPTQIFTGLLVIGLMVSLFITQLHMTRKNMPPEALTGPMAQQQKMMLYMMPAMYLFTGLGVPSGVMVYWLTSNLWTLVQQWIMIRNSPAPNTPAYLDWEERMRAKGLDPKEIERERREKRSKKRATAPAVEAEADGTVRVQRQNVGAARGRKATPRTQSRSTGEAQGSDAPVVGRQQPKRTPRSVRKKN